jgi:predicted phosphate transport protein (TIGR00153 family)
LRLRIFPRDESYFDLFEEAAGNALQATHLLCDMVEDFVEPAAKAKKLVECEHEGDRITAQILVQLNSTFVTPFDREDIYALATGLDDVTDAIEAAADSLVLHKVTEPIQAVRDQARLLTRAAELTRDGMTHLRDLDTGPLQRYWMGVSDLEDEGDRLFRQAVANLYSFTAERPARHVLVWKDIVEQLEDALDGLQKVANTVHTIVLKHA